MLAEDFVEFGASGRVWSREAIIAELGNESFAPPSVEDFECRILCPGVLLVTYRTVRASSSKNGKTDEVLRSSIWRKTERGWRLSFHQGTRVDQREWLDC